MIAKHQSQFGKNIFVPLEDLVSFFLKMLWTFGFGATFSKMSTVEDKEFPYFIADVAVFLYPQYLLNGNYKGY